MAAAVCKIDDMLGICSCFGSEIPEYSIVENKCLQVYCLIQSDTNEGRYDDKFKHMLSTVVLVCS